VTAAGVGLLAALALSAPAAAEIYNPTTAEYIPTSYYYPPPAPSYDPPPLYFPPLDMSSSSAPSGGGDSEPSRGTGVSRERRVVGYTRSPRVSRQANRQMADLFAKRLGKRNFDRARFIKEADKGTFRKAFRQLVSPLGWSDGNYADAVAAYAVSSYLIANQIDLANLTPEQRTGAGKVEELVTSTLLGNRRMAKLSARAKQLATERLDTVTIVQLVQFANGDATARAAQAEATRAAGMKTFHGDLTTVVLDADGFQPK